MRKAFQAGLSRATEPQILFPLTAVLLLTAIWGSTLGMIRTRETAAAHAAAVSSRELLDTYEAQVVRAIHEIDQSLNLVRFWAERRAEGQTLEALKLNGLLPSDLIYTISIANRDGVVVSSTRPFKNQSIADQDYFRAQREADDFFMSRLAKAPTRDAKLHFSRRLNAANGAFNGIAIVAVDASYFVSNYEPTKLGAHGVLGLLGADGVFRVRRTGDSLFSGDLLDYPAALAAAPDADGDPTISMGPVDDVRRWTGTREIYGFPVAVQVGLSVDEQMSAANRLTRIYLWCAALGSVVLMVLTALLGSMSWRMSQGRRRESEANRTHARKVEHLAYHDALTGLPNRSLFNRLLAQSLAEARRDERRLAVAFLDLDRFKQINDALGHEAGDQLLIEVATRLKGCVRDSDTIARLGGDEFVVLLNGLPDEQYAARVGEKILAVTAAPFRLIGQEFRITASIGICTYPQDGLDEQTLTKNADIAMYRAKAGGKNSLQFYSEMFNSPCVDRFSLESSLRLALEREEFQIHYQAKRDIVNGRITGAEALLRWAHPELGTMEPMRFIAVAEETGLIVPIGRWVLKTVCAQIVAWQKMGLPPLVIAVNLTPRQFCDDQLPADLTSILQTTGINPGLLEIELSERLLFQDIENAIRILTALKHLGIRIAVDEFGLGYSTLAMLQRFPLDTIKIHRSLMQEFVRTTEDAALADAIIAMGKSLSMTVVAQGVETREQAEFLRVHACDELQGFYFKRPQPAPELARLLREQAAGIASVDARGQPGAPETGADPDFDWKRNTA